MNQITSASAPIVAVFESAQSIRIIMIDNEPWFVAVDVCSALNLQNPSVVCSKLDEDERSKFNLGRQGGVTIINESGLNCIILRCDDAIKQGTVAHKFRKWVTGEVLPSLRKTGSYSMPVVPQEQEESREVRILSEDELLDLRRRVSVVARSFPCISPTKIAACLYSSLKSPFRVARINDLPAEALPVADGMITRLNAAGRSHYMEMRRRELDIISEVTGFAVECAQ